MILEVLKAIARRKADHFDQLVHGDKERFDKDLPLNIRLKCTVRLDRTPFLLAGEDKLCFKYPGSDHTVEAVGREKFDQLEFFNFYLRNLGEESVLQVVRDLKTKETIEAVLYREVYKIFPAPDGEFGDWPDWTGENGMIGSFIFNTPAENSYEIVMPACPGDHVNPISCKESVTDDPNIEEVIRVKHQFAVYGRNLGEEAVEKLWISAREDDQGAYVMIMAGLQIDIASGKLTDSGFLQIM